MAVVGENLKVHGMTISDRRRSIMPTVTHANTNLTAIMIGERLADSLGFGLIRGTAPRLSRGRADRADHPLWAMIGAAIFLRDTERINLPIVVGTLSVVAGTVAIILSPHT